MIKKIFNLSLMAALLCGLSLGVVSCSDDDDTSSADGNNGGDDQEIVDPNDTPEIHTAWTWLSSLTDAETQPEGWDQQTYEPTIGQPSLNNVNARVIFVRDIDDARMNFSAIAGCDPSDLTTKKTISAGEYGTMEWTPSAAGAANIATVDVETKLIPKLSRIIYCTPDQADENASGVTGTAYYRLGDVIEDADGYYWVCVRPSFSQNKATDSYWVNIFNAAETGRGVKTGKLPGIPDANIYSKYNKKYNNNTILLPTALKSSREHVYNLANLISALTFPDNYKTKVGTAGKGLCGFDYKYHGANFLAKVNQYWLEGGIWEKLFNSGYMQMKSARVMYFFYNGYHWKVGSTAGVWLYKATNGYQTQYTGSMGDDDTLFEMKEEGAGFDIRRYASDPQQDKNCSQKQGSNYAPDKQFFGDKRRWVVRYRSGKQFDKKYDPMRAITGVHEVYRYNAKTNKLEGEANETESELDIYGGGANSFYSGVSHYHLGDVYKDQHDHRWFVAAMSGISSIDTNLNQETVINDYESSPWTTLISFDGLEADENRSQLLKNPLSLKDAIRGTLFLWGLWQASAQSLDHPDLFTVTSRVVKYRSAANIFEHAGVDVRRLFQSITAQNGDKRQPSQVVSVMYGDGSTLNQRLLRFVCNQQNEYNNMEFYFWANYPKNPSATATKLAPSAFSDVTITLQDLLLQDMVNKYAEDSYARQPLDLHSGDDKAKTVREPRKTIDDRANNVSNYFYNKEAWEQNTFPADMWNAPVLAFRMTRVMDRGDSNYERNTEDGLTLTPVNLVNYEYDEDSNTMETEDMRGPFGMVFTMFDLVKLNGVKFLPFWSPISDK